MLQWAMRFIGLIGALFALALLAGCAGNSNGSVHTYASNSAGCTQMDRKMRALVAKGKKNTSEYRNLLDRYIGRGCYH